MSWKPLDTAVLTLLAVEQVIVPLLTARPRRVNWKRASTNIGLTTSLMVILPFINYPLLAFASTHALWSRPAWLVGPLVFLVDFFLLDFVKYIHHWLSHKNPIMWRFHAVHHLDEVLDMSTTDRGHFFDKIIRNVLRAGFVTVFAMPLESMVLAELISTPLGMFHHKESLKVPRWIADTIGKVLTMPGFHAVHHSRHLPHTNSNFGITLCLWDYIFGTAGLTRPVEGMSRGLNDHHDLGFFALFFGPFLPGFLQQSAAVRAVADVPVLSGTK